MANFMQDSVVKYACSCGILNPISKLFFCRHCLKLRCGFCVCHEVDSHFCSNCLENIPSSEARHKKNCCANCFDCPCCQHTLSARATTVILPKKPDDAPKEGEPVDASKVYTKKMYYLSCLSCRWTSRDAGIPDQGVATGAWPDNECSYRTRFDALLDYYQAVVLQEKQERQEYMRRKAPKVHKFPTLTDRTGLTVSIIRRQMGWAEKTSQKVKPAQIQPSLATDDVGELPDFVFKQKVDLRKVTTMKQRLNQPADQPFNVNKLYPQRRFLWIKRSLRCRQCEHNVIKPEYHPTSVKYRIQLFANYHMPEVIMVRCEPGKLEAGKLCSVILKITNPTIHEMPMEITELPNKEKELEMIEEFKKACSLKEVNQATAAAESLKSVTGVTTTAPLTGASTPLTSLASSSSVSLTRQSSLMEEPRVVGQASNAKLETLNAKFVLSQRDDSKEFDDDVQIAKEEEDFITWRKANKIAIRLQFTPEASLEPGDPVFLGFGLQYTYINTVTNTPEKKEPTPHDLSARIYIKVGTIEK